MAKRIEIIGKSLVVTDTVSSAVLLDVPKSDYYYNIKRLVDNGLIVFYNLDFKDNLKSSPDPIYLSEAVDSTDTAFDEAGFIAFCRANLGFRFGEGDVTVNPLTLYPVENEYLDINSVGELLDDQVNQTENYFQYVADASADARVGSGEAYYQKLSTSTGSLSDYRLLTDTEVLVLQNSNSWRIFRISAINNDASPLTTVPNTRVGVDYNVGTDYVTAFLFDRFFSDTIENISTASNMSIQVYNQNTDIIYLATITSFDIVGQYLRANVTSTIDKDSWAVNQRLEFVFDSAGGAGGSETLDVQTPITISTTFNGTETGLTKLYQVDSASNLIMTMDKGTHTVGQVINFVRNGFGAVEIKRGTNVRLEGVRDINNQFFINDKGNMAAVVWKYLDGSILVGSVIGRITTGYTGAVTTSAYTGLAPAETTDVGVTGTGFSANMQDPVITGNATLNSWIYNSPTSITLNITSSGSEGDKLTITYDNGDVFVDTDCITMTTASLTNITFTTTSTSASYTPTLITNSGATLHWEVMGDVTPSSYDANSPSMDLSSNVGIATIIVTSADDLAGLTVFRMSSKNLTSIDPHLATALTELTVDSNQITGTINTTGMTALSIFKCFINSGLTSLDVTTNTALTQLWALNCGLTSAPDLSNNTALTSLRIGANPSMGNIDLSANTALVTIEIYQTGATGALDFTANTLCTSLQIYTNATATSVDVTGMTVLASINGNTSGYTHVTGLGDSGALLGSVNFTNGALSQSGVNNMIIDTNNNKTTGTRLLNYSVGSGTSATPTVTESVANDVLDAYNELIADGWTITGAVPA